MTFTQKLSNAVDKTNSNLCVGLDPYLDRIPNNIVANYSQSTDWVLYFLKEIIKITSPHCAAYKPNLAFFEALGANGLDVFEQVLNFIPDKKIIIADIKRGDISSTANHYATAYFEKFDVDAVTLNPLMGFEALEPFLDYENKGVFVLTLTSNPGADDFLKQSFAGESSMAEYIAANVATINSNHSAHAGMVVGATQAHEIEAVIQHHPEAALLIPGMGAQGGDIESFKTVLQTHEGVPLFNSSRGILYAGEGTDDWKEAVKEQTIYSKNKLKSILTDDG